jgi:hypothetical protein
MSPERYGVPVQILDFQHTTLVRHAADVRFHLQTPRPGLLFGVAEVNIESVNADVRRHRQSL